MKISDIEFTEFISEAQLQEKVRALATSLRAYYAGKTPVFLPVLNGAFMFAADLLRNLEAPCRVSFAKVSSYEGVSSTGQLRTLIGVEESLFQQDVVIVEDIVDTGLTLEKIVADLKSLGTRSVQVAALLRKRIAREKNIDVQFTGFDIDDEFVLGYGMDYNGFGRNLPQLFKAVPASRGR